MKTFWIIEETPILMVRRFKVEAETFEEAMRAIKDGDVDAYDADYLENVLTNLGHKSEYYLDEEETNP
jgi:hypothetical protein